MHARNDHNQVRQRVEQIGTENRHLADRGLDAGSLEQVLDA